MATYANPNPTKRHKCPTNACSMYHTQQVPLSFLDTLTDFAWFICKVPKNALSNIWSLECQARWMDRWRGPTTRSVFHWSYAGNSIEIWISMVSQCLQSNSRINWCMVQQEMMFEEFQLHHGVAILDLGMEWFENSESPCYPAWCLTKCFKSNWWFRRCRNCEKLMMMTSGHTINWPSAGIEDQAPRL